MRHYISIVTIFLLILTYYALCLHVDKKNEFQVILSQYYDTVKNDSDSTIIKTGHDTLYYPNKKIKAVGNFVMFCDIKSDIKIGFWIEYYSNGQMKSCGNYQITGWAENIWVYTNYKTGEWKYYYDNGQIMATGIYKVKMKRIKTNYWGGTKVFKSFLSRYWTYFNDKGEQIKLSKEIKSEIEDASP